MRNSTRMVIGQTPRGGLVGCAIAPRFYALKSAARPGPGSKFRPELTFGLTTLQVIENIHRGSNQPGTLFRLVERSTRLKPPTRVGQD
jgi:hypothetical protein